MRPLKSWLDIIRIIRKDKGKNMNKYYITKNRKKHNHAGSKAVNDSDEIMYQKGYKCVCIYPSMLSFTPIRWAINFISLFKILFIKRNSMVVVEHPLYIAGVYMLFLNFIKKVKKCKLVFLIHDFETVRNFFPDDKGIRKIEKDLIHIADYFIVHNKTMKKYFCKRFKIDEEKMTELRAFDYLCDGKDNIEPETKDSVVVAGNLDPEKCGYVYKLAGGNYDVYLYGVNYQENDNQNVSSMGSVDADILPGVMKGKYGLVWDGDSIDCCSGISGRYLRLNNPHKMSLYIASGIPVITWSKAAIASFILENEIGFVVDSLDEISGKIKSIDEAKYNRYINNITELSLKVRSGQFLTDALTQVEEKML